MEKLVLIDGNSLINRAYYALPGLSSKQGGYCGAIYGFTNILLKIISTIKPKYMGICFDAGKKTFRNEIYAEYKGTRKPMPTELAEQLPKLKELLRAMNIYIVEQIGVEADDLIGSLSKKFDIETIIVSGDRDLLQLIDETTQVHLTKKGITETAVMNLKSLKDEMGLEPYQVIELKALMGDASDNIPGVAGVGEKTAKSLIQTYQNVDNLYQNIDEQKGQLKEKLIDGKTSCYMSKTLATINTAIPLDVTLEDMQYDFPFNSKVLDLFRLYEFNSLIVRENIFEKEAKQVIEIACEIIENDSQLTKLIEQLKTVNSFAIYLDNKQIHISMSKYKEYIIKYSEQMTLLGLNFTNILERLKPVLENEKIKKICFDVKALKHILFNFGVNLKGAEFDVSLAQYLVSGSKKSADNLDVYLSSYSYDKNSIACLLLKMKEDYQKKLTEDDLIDLYQKIEFPLIEVLFDMEVSGFKLDKKILDKFCVEYREQTEKLSQEIKQMSGCEFNPNSPKQLAEVLYDKLLLPKPKKAGTGVEVLERLRGAHPIIDKILEYRKISKLYTTYLQDFGNMLDEKNLIHTIFNQTLTATGRLSSQEPNLQNIPVKTEEGKELRKMFISRFENGLIISADYSQIELRLLAHFSQEPKLIDAYKNGLDIHTKTASDLFGVPLDQVDNDMRRKAKTVNFGIIYGMSEYGLSQSLKISPSEAKNFINNYFETFPYVKTYMDNNVEYAKKNGYAISLLGRKRTVDEVMSSNYQTRQFGERVSKNMPLQGSASDIIKLAMVRVYNAIKQNNLKSKLILQIHDELIVDTYPTEEDKIKQILKDVMENVVNLNVPLTVAISSGKTWFDAK